MTERALIFDTISCDGDQAVGAAFCSNDALFELGCPLEIKLREQVFRLISERAICRKTLNNEELQVIAY